jgi:hypothetical protein
MAGSDSPRTLILGDDQDVLAERPYGLRGQRCDWLLALRRANAVVRMLACLLVSVSCENEPVRAPQATVRDSAGVRIVQYETLKDIPYTIQLSDPPFLDIGGLQSEPNEELSPSGPWLEPVELSDGRFVVSDAYRLVFFDARGKFLRSAGRRGDGPGEFQQVGRVCRLPGDTLLAISENDRRVLLWDKNGEHIRTFPRPGPVLLESCFPDGTLIAPAMEARVPADGIHGRSPIGLGEMIEYRRLRPDRSQHSSLGFHPRSLLDGSPTYYVFVLYARGRLYVADPRRYAVQVFDTTGILRLVVRVTEPLPVARRPGIALARGSRAPIVVQAPGPATSSEITEPAFGWVLVDSVGRIWLSKSFRGPDQWAVFDSTGVALGRLRLTMPSKGFPPSLVSFGRDYAVVRTTDQDGSPHLVFYKVRVGTLRR